MLITMPVYCTIENERYGVARQSIASLLWSARTTESRILIANNAGNDERMVNFLKSIDQHRVSVVQMERNVFNVGVFNLGMSLCGPDEVFCTAEDDVFWKRANWPDFLNRLILDHTVYGAALCPISFTAAHLVWSKQEYEQNLRNVAGFGEIKTFSATQLWNGSTAWHPLVRKKIGYFHPPRDSYGYTDALYCQRVNSAEFKPIVHIWDWPLEYLDHQPRNHYWRSFKRNVAKAGAQAFQTLSDAYTNGERPLYEDIYPIDMSFTVLSDNAHFWS